MKLELTAEEKATVAGWRDYITPTRDLCKIIDRLLTDSAKAAPDGVVLYRHTMPPHTVFAVHATLNTHGASIGARLVWEEWDYDCNAEKFQRCYGGCYTRLTPAESAAFLAKHPIPSDLLAQLTGKPVEQSDKWPTWRAWERKGDHWLWTGTAMLTNYCGWWDTSSHSDPASLCKSISDANELHDPAKSAVIESALKLKPDLFKAPDRWPGVRVWRNKEYDGSAWLYGGDGGDWWLKVYPDLFTKPEPKRSAVDEALSDAQAKAVKRIVLDTIIEVNDRHPDTSDICRAIVRDEIGGAK
jgi:hypothetical protein